MKKQTRDVIILLEQETAVFVSRVNVFVSRCFFLPISIAGFNGTFPISNIQCQVILLFSRCLKIGSFLEVFAHILINIFACCPGGAWIAQLVVPPGTLPAVAVPRLSRCSNHRAGINSACINHQTILQIWQLMIASRLQPSATARKNLNKEVRGALIYTSLGDASANSAGCLKQMQRQICNIYCPNSSCSPSRCLCALAALSVCCTLSASDNCQSRCRSCRNKGRSSTTAAFHF